MRHFFLRVNNDVDVDQAAKNICSRWAQLGIADCLSIQRDNHNILDWYLVIWLDPIPDPIPSHKDLFDLEQVTLIDSVPWDYMDLRGVWMDGEKPDLGWKTGAEWFRAGLEAGI